MLWDWFTTGCSIRSATTFKFLAAAAGAWRIFAQIGLQVDFAHSFNDAVEIKPAAVDFGKAADFIHDVLFAILVIKRFKRHHAFAVLCLAFFAVGNFQS